MGIELALDSGNADMCVQPRARGAQLRRSQPAFIIVMVMKLVSIVQSFLSCKLVVQALLGWAGARSAAERHAFRYWIGEF